MDLESEREVETAEGKQLARVWNCPFHEVSRKMAISRLSELALTHLPALRHQL